MTGDPARHLSDAALIQSHCETKLCFFLGMFFMNLFFEGLIKIIIITSQLPHDDIY